MAKIAINGFGRIGRLFFRQAFGNGDLDIVAINDLGSIDNLAYLLKYDSVYKTFEKQVSVDGNNLVIGGKKVQILQEKDPTKLPWGDLGVDVVVEATGVFTSFEKASVHTKEAGAKRVVITAPAKDEEGSAGGRTILMGVNGEEMKTCTISSNGSCTTNATSPLAAIMDEKIGVVKAILNTVHGYTATQALTDGPSKKESDFRRGRAAAANIIPSTTGAAIAVTRAFENLEGKFDGMAIRVPVLAGSLVDFTFIAKKPTTVEEVNQAFESASKEPRWKNIIKVTNDQIVSSDIIGEPYGAIIDQSYTKVVDGDLVKVLAWYDNEWGYVTTLVKHVVTAAKTV